MADDNTLNGSTNPSPFAASSAPFGGFGKRMEGYTPPAPPPQPTHGFNPSAQPAEHTPIAEPEAPAFVQPNVAAEPAEQPYAEAEQPFQPEPQPQQEIETPVEEPAFEVPQAQTDIPAFEPAPAEEAPQPVMEEPVPMADPDVPSFSARFGGEQVKPDVPPAPAPEAPVEADAPEADAPSFDAPFADAPFAQTAPEAEVPTSQPEPASAQQPIEEAPQAFAPAPETPETDQTVDAEKPTPQQVWDDILNPQFKLVVTNGNPQIALSPFVDLPEQAQQKITENADFFLEQFTQIEAAQKATQDSLEQLQTILKSDAVKNLDGKKRIQAARINKVIGDALEGNTDSAVIFHNQGGDLLEAFAEGIEARELIDQIVETATALIDGNVIFPADVYKFNQHTMHEQQTHLNDLQHKALHGAVGGGHGEQTPPTQAPEQPAEGAHAAKAKQEERGTGLYL